MNTIRFPVTGLTH